MYVHISVNKITSVRNYFMDPWFWLQSFSIESLLTDQVQSLQFQIIFGLLLSYDPFSMKLFHIQALSLHTSRSQIRPQILPPRVLPAQGQDHRARLVGGQAQVSLPGRLQARLPAAEPKMRLLRVEAGGGEVLLPREGCQHQGWGWDRGHSQLLMRLLGSHSRIKFVGDPPYMTLIRILLGKE